MLSDTHFAHALKPRLNEQVLDGLPALRQLVRPALLMRNSSSWNTRAVAPPAILGHRRCKLVEAPVAAAPDSGVYCEGVVAGSKADLRRGMLELKR